MRGCFYIFYRETFVFVMGYLTLLQCLFSDACLFGDELVRCNQTTIKLSNVRTSGYGNKPWSMILYFADVY